MINIELTNKKNFSIYREELMNEYNKTTKARLDEIKNLISNGFFVVPSVEYKQAWGKEKVFLPFTNKLFKIIETSNGNTSLQLHPLKNEEYVALNDSTVVFDNDDSIKLKKYDSILIKNNTIHSLKINSKVFEEQDNNLFDRNETIRFHDYLGRKVNKPCDYYKYLMPKLKSTIKRISTNKIPLYKKYDKFLFLIDGYFVIEYNGVEYILKNKEELYYLDKRVLLKKICGNIKISKCIYYNMVNYEKKY